MSTRALKITTSIMLLLCVVLLVAWPVFLGARPAADAALALKKDFAIKFVVYVSILVFFLLIAGVCAILIMRRTANEYREMQMENMRQLIEATLQDQKRKNDGQPGVE